MSLCKLAGQPKRPIGDVIQWNWPLPGMVKAVNFCESLSSCICQNPEVRSKVVKIVESALQMFANTFGDFLHRVCVNMGVLVELPEFLNDPVSLALFLWNAENG